jgi:hypothetical protein
VGPYRAGPNTQDERDKLVSRLSNALGLIQFVGSPEVALMALALFKEAMKEEEDEAQSKLGAFLFAARKDLGYTVTRPIHKEIDKEIDRLLPPFDEED